MPAQMKTYTSEADLTPLTKTVQELFACASSPDELATYCDEVMQKVVSDKAASRKEELSQENTTCSE